MVTENIDDEIRRNINEKAGSSSPRFPASRKNRLFWGRMIKEFLICISFLCFYDSIKKKKFTLGLTSVAISHCHVHNQSQFRHSLVSRNYHSFGGVDITYELPDTHRHINLRVMKISRGCKNLVSGS